MRFGALYLELTYSVAVLHFLCPSLTHTSPFPLLSSLPFFCWLQRGEFEVASEEQLRARVYVPVTINHAATACE